MHQNQKYKAEEYNKNFKIAEFKTEMNRYIVQKLGEIVAQRGQFFKQKYGLVEVDNRQVIQEISQVKDTIHSLKMQMGVTVEMLTKQMEGLHNRVQNQEMETRKSVENSRSMIGSVHGKVEALQKQTQQMVKEARRDRQQMSVLIQSLGADEEKFKKQMLKGQAQLVAKLRQANTLSATMTQSFQTQETTNLKVKQQLKKASLQIDDLESSNIQTRLLLQSVSKEIRNNQLAKLASFTNTRLLHLQNYIQKYETFYSYTIVSDVLSRVLPAEGIDRLREENRRILDGFNRVVLDDTGVPDLSKRIKQAGMLLESFQKDTVRLRSKSRLVRKQRVDDVSLVLAPVEKVVKEVSQTSNNFQVDLSLVREEVISNRVYFEQKLKRLAGSQSQSLAELKCFLQSRIQHSNRNIPTRKSDNLVDVFRCQEMFKQDALESSRLVLKSKFNKDTCHKTSQSYRRSRTPTPSIGFFSQRKSTSNNGIIFNDRYL